MSTPSCESPIWLVARARSYATFFSSREDIDRVLERDYVPSDEDVVKARFQTVGVQEYHFSIPTPGTYPILGCGTAACPTFFQTEQTTTGSCMMLEV